MPTINEIYDFLNAKAPVSIKMDFDNPGFLVGDGAWETNRVLLALDITDWVVEEAARGRAASSRTIRCFSASKVCRAASPWGPAPSA